MPTLEHESADSRQAHCLNAFLRKLPRAHRETKAQFLQMSQKRVLEAAVFFLRASQYFDYIVFFFLFVLRSKCYEVIFRLVSPLALYNACIMWLCPVNVVGCRRVLRLAIHI